MPKGTTPRRWTTCSSRWRSTGRIGDRAGEGTTLNNISQIYRCPRGLRHGAGLPATVAGDPPGDRRPGGGRATLNNISQIYHAQGDYATALDYLEQSLAIRRAIGDRAGEGTTLNNISQIYQAQGDYATALDYLQQSLAISRAHRRPGGGRDHAQQHLGRLYHARGDYATALEYLQQSLAIRRAIGDRAGEGTTLNNISQIYQARGDYDTALRYLEQSLAIRRADRRPGGRRHDAQQHLADL